MHKRLNAAAGAVSQTPPNRSGIQPLSAAPNLSQRSGVMVVQFRHRHPMEQLSYLDLTASEWTVIARLQGGPKHFRDFRDMKPRSFYNARKALEAAELVAVDGKNIELCSFPNKAFADVQNIIDEARPKRKPATVCRKNRQRFAENNSEKTGNGLPNRQRFAGNEGAVKDIGSKNNLSPADKSASEREALFSEHDFGEPEKPKRDQMAEALVARLGERYTRHGFRSKFSKAAALGETKKKLALRDYEDFERRVNWYLDEQARLGKEPNFVRAVPSLFSKRMCGGIPFWQTLEITEPEGFTNFDD